MLSYSSCSNYESAKQSLADKAPVRQRALQGLCRGCAIACLAHQQGVLGKGTSQGQHYWVWLQVLQAGFVEKTAQLQALQQQVSGHRTPDPELTALQHEMHESQARHNGILSVW